MTFRESFRAISRSVLIRFSRSGFLSTSPIDASVASIDADLGCPVNRPISPVADPGRISPRTLPDSVSASILPLSRISMSVLGAPAW